MYFYFYYYKCYVNINVVVLKILSKEINNKFIEIK